MKLHNPSVIKSPLQAAAEDDERRIESRIKRLGKQIAKDQREMALAKKDLEQKRSQRRSGDAPIPYELTKAGKEVVS